MMELRAVLLPHEAGPLDLERVIRYERKVEIYSKPFISVLKRAFLAWCLFAPGTVVVFEHGRDSSEEGAHVS